EVTRESDFYGAMDGASKFVRGDAIAGLIITAINIVGGLIIGVAQRGLSVSESASQYTILSVGDGLLAQIPALLISTAAGIIVSRASAEGNIASELKGQLFKKSHPLLITGGFLALLGMVPGLPLIPFWALAAVTLLMGRKRVAGEKQEAQEALLAAREAERPKEEATSDLLLVDP